MELAAALPKIGAPNQRAIVSLTLVERVPAYVLSSAIEVLDSLYFAHLWLEVAESTGKEGPVPDPYQPADDETLYIRRVDIGTPNFLEVIGYSAPLLGAFKYLASAFGLAKIGMKFFKEGAEVEKILAEGKKAKAEADKLMAEKNKIEMETTLLSLDLAERARNLRKQGVISEEQLQHKIETENHARAVIENIVLPNCRDPQLAILEIPDLARA